MGIMMQFTIYLTLILLLFLVAMILIEIFCVIVRSINRIRPVSLSLLKMVEVLDWMKEDK